MNRSVHICGGKELHLAECSDEEVLRILSAFQIRRRILFAFLEPKQKGLKVIAVVQLMV